MTDKRERLVTEIILDIEGHEAIVKRARRNAEKARARAAFWEAHVCSHSAILRDLRRELSERMGEPFDDCGYMVMGRAEPLKTMFLMYEQRDGATEPAGLFFTREEAERLRATYGRENEWGITEVPVCSSESKIEEGGV